MSGSVLPKPDYYVISKGVVVSGPVKKPETAEKMASALARDNRETPFIVVKAVGTFRFS